MGGAYSKRWAQKRCVQNFSFETWSEEIKLHDFKKNFMEHKIMCFDFLYNLVWYIAHSMKKWAKYYHKYA